MGTKIDIKKCNNYDFCHVKVFFEDLPIRICISDYP